MDSIIKLLDLEDNVIIENCKVENGIRYITVSREPVPTFCPICGRKMESKGVYCRHVKHSIMQDKIPLVIVLKKRKWYCKYCHMIQSDQFKFSPPYKQTTNVTELLILDDLRNLSNSAASIARKYNVSDTQVNRIFEKYVDMKRLPFSKIICIDEVHSDVVPYSRYSMVILDFLTGDPIDVLPSRQRRDTENYFLSIPREERARVKYIITDMYSPYLNYVPDYFPNARVAVDSYHVIQWLNNRIMNYLRRLLKEAKAADEKRKVQMEANGLKLHKGWQSDRYYLLKKAKWVILKNQDDIDYTAPPSYDRHFRYSLDAYKWEYLFFNLDPNLRPMRDLKEEYVVFNRRYAGNPNGAQQGLERLIDEFSRSELPMFRDFSALLKQYRSQIITSFIIVKRYDHSSGRELSARLSNGMMESFNRKPKDIIRLARGYGNFEHFRNRLLFACRNNPTINGKSYAKWHLTD